MARERVGPAPARGAGNGADEHRQPLGPDSTTTDERDVEAASDLWSLRADLGPLLRTPPSERQWFVDHRIEAGRGVLLTGLGGSSKTRVLYYLAAGAVLGRLPWDWSIERGGSALLVLTEDTNDDLHQAIHPLGTALGVDDLERQAIETRLHAFPVAGRELRLLDSADGRTLIRTGWYQALQELIESLGDVVFVGLDPALALTAGDEMDQGHQRQLGKAVDDLAVNTGAAVVLTSHATKASLAQEELQSHASRGGGAITDAVRAEFSMRTMTPTEAAKAGITDVAERKRHVQLVATKGNHVPPAAYAPIWLRRGPNHTLTQARIDFDQGPSAGPNARDMRALRTLVRMAQSATPRLVEWRAQCVTEGVFHAVTSEAERKTMDRIKNRLRRAGFIEQGMGAGFWVPTEAAIQAVGDAQQPCNDDEQ